MMKKIHLCAERYYWKGLVAALLILSSSAAHAQNESLNPLSVSTIDQLVDIILRAIIAIGVPVLTFMLILTGFYYVTAMGDTSKIGKVHSMLQYTLYGAILILGAKVLHEILKNTLTQLHV